MLMDIFPGWVNNYLNKSILNLIIFTTSNLTPVRTDSSGRATINNYYDLEPIPLPVINQ